MRIQLLRTFVVVAEVGSISRAAQRLVYSNSSVFYHIRDLEKILGVRLFERMDKSMELTMAGRAIAPFAKDLLFAAEQIAERTTSHKAKQHAATSGGPLRGSSRDPVKVPAPRRPSVPARVGSTSPRLRDGGPDENS